MNLAQLRPFQPAGNLVTTQQGGMVAVRSPPRRAIEWLLSPMKSVATGGPGNHLWI